MGVTVAPRQGFAACVTVYVLLAIVSVALRSAPAFEPTETATLALPEPELTLVIQLGLPLTVHAQPAGAVIVTVLLPPECEKACPVELIVGAGKQGLAAWLTARLRPAIVSVALRAPAVFALTEYARFAFPVPPEPMVSHEGAPLTVQEHVAEAVTDTVAVEAV